MTNNSERFANFRRMKHVPDPIMYIGHYSTEKGFCSKANLKIIKNVRLFYHKGIQEKLICYFSSRVKFYLKKNTIYVKVVVLKMKLPEPARASTSGPAPGLHPGPSRFDEVSCSPRPSTELDTTTLTIWRQSLN